MELPRATRPRGHLPEASVRRATPSEVLHLFEASTRHFHALYPSESNHLLSPEEFEELGAVLLGAHIEGLLVGCGGLVHQALPHHGEIKRLFIEPAYRRQGIARLLMHELEHEARALEMNTLQLESGSREHEALALYRSLGYEECGPFGSYSLDPNSVFFEKRLTVNPG